MNRVYLKCCDPRFIIVLRFILIHTKLMKNLFINFMQIHTINVIKSVCENASYQARRDY